MQGNIHIEVLNESAVMVAAHLKDVSLYDKQVLIMALASSLNLTRADFFLTTTLYPDFLDSIKTAKTDLSNNRSTPN